MAAFDAMQKAVSLARVRIANVVDEELLYNDKASCSDPNCDRVSGAVL